MPRIKFDIATLMTALSVTASTLAQDPTWRAEITLTNRSGAGMVYDSARDVVFLFGGDPNGGFSPGSNDTWIYSSSTWTQLQPITAPPPRSGHGMANDPTRGSILLFGGGNSTRTAAYADTWEWNGNRWNQMNAGGPGMRTDCAMAFDPTLNTVILFGGFDASTGQIMNDTWMFDWNQRMWVLLPIATRPPARVGHRMVSDRRLGEIVLFGGRDDLFGGLDFDDTWVFRGGQWIQRIPLLTPLAQSFHGMAFDETRDRTVLFGENFETWEWSGASWSRGTTTGIVPDVEQDHSMAFSRQDRAVILFGGGHGTAGDKGGTWKYDGSQWMEETATPSMRSHPAMAYDEGRGRIVLFGGRFLFGAIFDTWEWDGIAWERKQTSQAPTGMHFFNEMVYRRSSGTCILYNGRETWEWNGSVWRRLLLPNQPPSRDLHAIAYDSTRDRIVLFGGRVWPPVPGGPTEYGDTWEFDGTTWTELFPATAPRDRSWHSMQYDEVRGKTVLFGGQYSPETPIPGDTWEWDGTTWTQIQTQNAPATSMGSALAYHTVREKMVLYGGGPGLLAPGLPGSIGGLSSSETWEYDGANWVRTARFLPAPRENAAMAYDSARQRVVMFGGHEATPVSFRFDTPAVWTYFSNTHEFIPRRTSIGNPINLLVRGGLPHARQPYVWGFSLGRVTGAGFVVRQDRAGNGISLPINPIFDPLFQVTAGQYFGLLDPQGEATLTLQIPNSTALISATVFSSAVSFNAVGAVDLVTNESIITINN